MPPELAAVVMAGGLGTRMRSATSKHFHPLLGQPLIAWVFDAIAALEPERTIAVTQPETRDSFPGVITVVQDPPLGTGDAVASVRDELSGFDGDILVMAGDTPLVTGELLAGAVAKHREQEADVTVLSFVPDRPLPYGRPVRGADGSLRAIVEDDHATPEQRETKEVTAWPIVFRAAALWPALDAVEVDPAKGEIYLTHAVANVIAAGGRGAVFECPDPAAPIGVNTRADLAHAAAVLRDRVNEAHMLDGVTIVDPQTTWIEKPVELEPDCVVHPFTVLRGSTRVAGGAEIGPHAIAEDADIGPDAEVGPFCYLRPGTVLAAGAKAGTFVEIKNARVGERSKVPHLSYVGDAEIGEDTNIGAGAITANFPHEPGRPKQRTKIGRNVRTAVHNAFVAPVEIGDDAWTAAGSVITDDVPPGSLAGFPPRQITKEGYVRAKRGDDD
jgi:bifunctional UDP-N-acetylglucosamine pyrophosphorylase/glucosamine-1-phosphate N-acetyltransferase